MDRVIAKHKIIIYADRNLKFLFQDLLTTLNSQFHFKFVIADINGELENIVNSKSIDFNQHKEVLTRFKLLNGYNQEDMILLFTYALLSDSLYGVSNLFLTGRSVNEENGCASIASVKNIEWKIFEELYSYEIQKHSLLHLLICSLISTYCDLNPHLNTNGCLLDIDNNLIDFKQKISKGYFLCNVNGCFDTVEHSKYGASIIQLCSTLRNSSFSKHYVNLPLNDVRSEIINAKIIDEDYFQKFTLKVYEYAVKNPIEEWGFYNFLWRGEQPVGERQAQIALNALFKIVLEIRAINIGKETETAGGSIDFLLTHNSGNSLFKVGIEVKNAHHQRIEDSYAQLISYLKAEKTKCGILIILWYKSGGFDQPKNFESKFDLINKLDSIEKGDYKIETLLIDCTPKIAPSKMKR